MEVPRGKGGAVCGHQEVGPFKKGGLGRHQLELHRPMAQGRGPRRDRLRPLKLPQTAARADEDLRLRLGLGS